MRISDWSSDVCSSDLQADAVDLADVHAPHLHVGAREQPLAGRVEAPGQLVAAVEGSERRLDPDGRGRAQQHQCDGTGEHGAAGVGEAQHGQPVRLTVLPPPQKSSDSTRLRRTTETIERRMARPTAMPTPAGPPDAL